MKSAIKNLAPGSYFYFRHDSLYYLFQLLEVSTNQVLVQRFWSTTMIPSMSTLQLFDVKSACSEFEEEFDQLVLIGNEEITAEQQQEIIQFLKIKTAKIARDSGFMTLKKQAIEAFEAQDYQEAVRLFSLAAPYSKYDIEVYEKRGLAYLKLQLFSDALADFDYYLIHDPENDLVKAAFQSAQKELAKKK